MMFVGDVLEKRGQGNRWGNALVWLSLFAGQPLVEMYAVVYICVRVVMFLLSTFSSLDCSSFWKTSGSSVRHSFGFCSLSRRGCNCLCCRLYVREWLRNT